MGILFKQAQAAAIDGILSSRDIGKLISTSLQNGEVSYGEIKELEKIAAEMESAITPDARVALNRFLALGPTFDGNLAGEIFGLGEADADKLEAQGISSLKDLMISSKMPEDRERLANEAQIDLAKLTSFVEQADLARTVGVGKQYSALLHGVGINNVQELSQQDPAELKQKLDDFIASPEGQAISRRRPSERSLTKWIHNARTLPKLMHYVGDNDPSFTTEAFGALRDSQKAVLLWGSDVRLGDGSVFEHEDLTVSVPRRKPAAINDAIQQLEDNGIEGDFEYAELTDIHRVKLGDDTLGYRLEFEVGGVEGLDSEHASVDSEHGSADGVEGYAYVALDANGKILDIEYDVFGGDHEV